MMKPIPAEIMSKVLQKHIYLLKKKQNENVENCKSKDFEDGALLLLRFFF